MPTTERTSSVAVEGLIELYECHKPKVKGGQGLTQEKIRRGVGVETVITVNRWIKRHNAPKGLELAALNRFLDKAKDKAWLRKLIDKE